MSSTAIAAATQPTHAGMPRRRRSGALVERGRREHPSAPASDTVLDCGDGRGRSVPSGTGPPRSAAAKSRGGPEPVGGVLGERRADDRGAVARARRRAAAAAGSRRWARAVATGESRVERPPAGQALVEHDAERVDVAGRGGRRALGLLGREVLRGADDLAGLGERDARRRPGRCRSR